MPAMDVLDIGGGFSIGAYNKSNNCRGNTSNNFENVAPKIEEMLREWPGVNNGVHLMGEPGRYIAQEAGSLVV
jgi:diaminopimelate decarboxylase